MEYGTVDWIDAFLSKKCNKFFCRIDRSFIRDKFNITGLIDDESEDAYDRIAWLLIQGKTEQFDQYQQVTQESIQEHAEILYGLLHQRFILTSRGLNEMMEKYHSKEFGVCPRHFCHSNSLLPIGLHDEKTVDCVKLYCSKCNDVYVADAKYSNVDGAYFGRTFAHLFFMVFPHLKEEIVQIKQYIPKVFGFKLHSSSHHRALECAKQDEIEYKKQKMLKIQRKQMDRNFKESD